MDQGDLRHVARDIKDTGPARGGQLRCDFRSEPAFGQPQIEDNKVRPGTSCERNRLGNGAGDAAYLVTVLDKDSAKSANMRSSSTIRTLRMHCPPAIARSKLERPKLVLLAERSRPGRPKNVRPEPLNLEVERARRPPHGSNRPLREWFRGLFYRPPQSIPDLAVE
jgi:hypothetical protein